MKKLTDKVYNIPEVHQGNETLIRDALTMITFVIGKCIMDDDEDLADSDDFARNMALRFIMSDDDGAITVGTLFMLIEVWNWIENEGVCAIPSFKILMDLGAASIGDIVGYIVRKIPDYPDFANEIDDDGEPLEATFSIDENLINYAIDVFMNEFPTYCKQKIEDKEKNYEQYQETVQSIYQGISDAGVHISLEKFLSRDQIEGILEDFFGEMEAYADLMAQDPNGMPS